MFFYNIFKGYTSSIPYLSDALFWLSGEVSGDTFVDRSGHGRHFTITDKDFTADYFPYKSAATISAPAGDAVLIAADINNFLYASGGTPNEIPVVSFFQNIDYEDKLFCKHIAQVLNANDVEVSEPYIQDIVLYDAVLTGDALTKATSYYGVPTEQTTTVKWVSKDGNDTTGDGSNALPWLTLQYAQTNATLGDLIYVKTGEYTETTYLTATKSMTVLGRVSFNGGGAGYNILVNTADTTFKNLIIEGDGAATYGFFINSNKTGVTLQSIYESGHGKQLVVATATGLIVKYCVGTSDTVYAVVRDQAGGVTVDTCMFAGNTTQCVKNITGDAGDVVVKNCKATGTITGFYDQSVAATSVKIYGNEFSSDVGVGYNTSGYSGTVEISYNSGTIGTQFINALAGGDIVVKNNTITMGGSSGSVLITERNCEVYGNIFKVTTTGTPLYITAASGSYTVDVHDNYLENASTGGMLNIGKETDLTPNTLSGSVYNNHCKGSFAVDGTTNSTHGIFVWLNGGIEVYNNFIEGCALSIVLKGNNTDYSSGMAFANICDGRIVVKGVINSNIIGNTINVTDDIGGGGTVFGINLLAESTYNSTGTIIKNNIIIVDVSGSLISCIQADDASQTFTADYNTYYNVNADWFRITTTDYTFAEWVILGNDANGNDLTSGELATLFTDADNNDFSLAAGSAAIGAGETLSFVSYGEGLDSDTDWGSTSILPSVVTAYQSFDWDIGSYIETGFDLSSAYAAVYDSFTTKPSNAIALTQNTLVRALEVAGIWAKLDFFYLFAQTVNTADEALLNWVGTTVTASLVGAPNPSFTSLEGFTNSASSYIDLGLSLDDGSNFGQDNGMIGGYCRTDFNALYAIMGAEETGTDDTLLRPRSSGLMNSKMCSGTAFTETTTTSLGLSVSQRTGASAVELFKNGASISTDTPSSVGVPTVNMFTLCYNNNGTPSNYMIGQVSCVFGGSALSAGQQLILFNAIEAYMDSNSKGVVT